MSAEREGAEVRGDTTSHRTDLSAAPDGREARRAKARGAALFGHFLLGKQEKVPRAPTSAVWYSEFSLNACEIAEAP